MISRLTRKQLIAFFLVTGISIVLMAASYVRIPELLGIGRYEVTVSLPATGGLYPKSLVTYRGQDVGTVTRLTLREGGAIDAVLSIDEGVDIPEDARVEVRSASAIGEQYINFVPEGDGARTLRDGDRIEAGAASLPVSTGVLLESVNDLFTSLPKDDLQTTIRELGEAFSGMGDELGRLLDAGTALQDVADAELDTTLSLIDSLDPVLAQQVALDPDIRGWARALDTFTGEFASSDKVLRSLLESGGPLAKEVVALVKDLDQPLPRLLTDLSLTGQVLEVYIPAIEHTLAVLPAAIEMHSAALPPERRDDAYPEANLSFKLSVNNPPTCNTGFEYADQQRSPKDLSPAPLPQDSYCKVAHDDPRVVRGARNQACPNAVGTFAADAAGCGLMFQESSEEDAEGQVAFYDNSSGRVMTPDGKFLRINPRGQDVAATWQDYLIGLGQK